MHRFLVRSLSWVLLLAAGACASGGDGGRDAGRPLPGVDAGSRLDAWSFDAPYARDVGPTLDTGPRPDAFRGPDTGPGMCSPACDPGETCMGTVCRCGAGAACAGTF